MTTTTLHQNQISSLFLVTPSRTRDFRVLDQHQHLRYCYRMLESSYQAYQGFRELFQERVVTDTWQTWTLRTFSKVHWECFSWPTSRTRKKWRFIEISKVLKRVNMDENIHPFHPQVSSEFFLFWKSTMYGSFLPVTPLEVLKLFFAVVHYLSFTHPSLQSTPLEGLRGLNVIMFFFCPFLLHNIHPVFPGYLMQMMLQLNHTDRKNGSMGLELSILEGEYDSILSWPFSHKFELMIINQRPPGDGDSFNGSHSSSSSQPSHHPISSSMTDSSTEDPGDIIVGIDPSVSSCDHRSFTRPIERNPPCGRKNVISFARVQRSSSGFVRLGSLLVKVRIYLAPLWSNFVRMSNDIQ